MAGSTILTFADEVGEAVKEDIKNATVLSSLASSSNYDVLNEAEILQVLGFVLQASDFSNYDMHSKSMKIDEIILNIGGLLTEETLQIKETMKVNKAQGKEEKLY